MGQVTSQCWQTRACKFMINCGMKLYIKLSTRCLCIPIWKCTLEILTNIIKSQAHWDHNNLQYYHQHWILTWMFLVLWCSSTQGKFIPLIFRPEQSWWTSSSILSHRFPTLVLFYPLPWTFTVISLHLTYLTEFISLRSVCSRTWKTNLYDRGQDQGCAFQDDKMSQSIPEA